MGTASHGRTFEGMCNEDWCNSGLPGEDPAAMIPAWSTMGAHDDCSASQKHQQTKPEWTGDTTAL